MLQNNLRWRKLYRKCIYHRKLLEEVVGREENGQKDVGERRCQGEEPARIGERYTEKPARVLSP